VQITTKPANSFTDLAHFNLYRQNAMVSPKIIPKARPPPVSTSVKAVSRADSKPARVNFATDCSDGLNSE
jgi:hypothetical protein